MTRIQRLSENLVYQNAFVVIHDDTVKFPSGATGSYVRIESAEPGLGVVVIPEFDNRLGLVRTFRYPLSDFQWAFPRGFAHGPDPLRTAAAELAEELGVVPTSMTLLGHVTPDSGLLATRVAVVRAIVEPAPGLPIDTDEVSGRRWVTTEEIVLMIGKGQLEDGFSLAALTLRQVAAGLDGSGSIANGG